MLDDREAPTGSLPAEHQASADAAQPVKGTLLVGDDAARRMTHAHQVPKIARAAQGLRQRRSDSGWRRRGLPPVCGSGRAEPRVRTIGAVTNPTDPNASPRDQDLIDLLRRRDGQLTLAKLADGRVRYIKNIAWGYDIGDHHAHVTTNISPDGDALSVDFFYTSTRSVVSRPVSSRRNAVDSCWAAASGPALSAPSDCSCRR